MILDVDVAVDALVHVDAQEGESVAVAGATRSHLLRLNLTLSSSLSSLRFD